ncbi:archaeosortase/exosortase family protein [Dysgonomonas sp. Marseille-P4677]|uniref:archaeosortase/exosortase family protein n=1 Tax=Dysgonomonas sp. Marseille-P4677 TaxID=2364790 RepID=UPI0019123CCF|nr:archaeosortase/exosortase family protein [Dysgonomonas sp. Marseille-P4677]MBK5723124.1 archaeosortase/exosortase family protein [Dysgonomonas sp. Marseille-P4677]
MNTKTNSYIITLVDRLKPFKDIIWFLCLFLIFEFIWKLCVHQGENERILIVLGKDLTAYTEGINEWTASSVYWVIHDVLGYDNFYIINDVTLYFENSIYIDIIWGCTGLKQFFMFTFIMLFYFGPAKKKLWFIPLSLFILLLINILRLAIIILIVKDPFPEWFIPINEWYNNCTWENTKECYFKFYEDWFNVFHRDIFVWIYYDGVIFVLWLIWEEKIRKPYLRIVKRNPTL